MNNKLNIQQATTKQLIGLILIAYLFSLAIRMIWVYQFHDNPHFIWNHQLMINTNDGYFFASGAQKALYGLHMHNPRLFGIWNYGVVFFTTLFTKITPFSLETVILYMPSIISSLVVIPIILIARLYKQTMWGFLAALLGSITWSYYNRTMTGYYDTDMFSAMAPMFILYFLIKSTIDLNLKTALWAAICIIIYPFLYDQGLSIIYAMGIIYAAYMVWFHRDKNITYASLILIFIALVPIGLEKPINYIVHFILLFVAYFVLQRKEFQNKKVLMVSSLIIFILFLLLGNVFGLIISKVLSYTVQGTEKEGALHFFAVNQTVREAGKVLFFPVSDNLPYKANIAHRMMGSSIGLIIAFIGYILLVIQKKEFILALPLIGIGIFAHWGGLRFTVYAVPVAAMSAVYLLFVVAEFFKEKWLKYAFIILATFGLIYPNITHIIGYKASTVFQRAEVQDLNKLKKISNPKDYTLTWWDYGYPIWYYGNTNTLIDGGKHNDDNFIISKILQSSSPLLMANFSRLAIEKYVDKNLSYAPISDVLFKETKKDPKEFLSTLESEDFQPPKKSRDIYFYMPFRMANIFYTVMEFGNLDLTTGKPLRDIIFYPGYPKAKKDGKILLTNGLIFDTIKGKVYFGKNGLNIRYFVVTENRKNGDIKIDPKVFHKNGSLAVIYLKSYNKFIVMDIETFASNYVQMGLLGNYDKNLFELVVKSPYTRIYKLKR